MALTKKQIALHWREWAKVRKALVQQYYFEPKEADNFRHTLYVRALGVDRSLNAMDNSDFDKILGVFRTYTRPADLDSQVRQIEQPKIRAAHVIKEYCEVLGVSENYIESMARRICKKAVWKCDEKDLAKLIAALNYHCKRKGLECPSNTLQEVASTVS